MSIGVTVPDPPADPERIRSAVEALRQRSASFETAVQDALFAWSLAPGLYRAPEADLLHRALGTTGPAAHEITAGLVSAGRALEHYADDLDRLAHDRNLLLTAQALAAPPRSVWQTGSETAAGAMNELARAEAEHDAARDVARLAEAYEDATHRCAMALRAIPDISWSSLAAWSGPEHPGAVPSSTDAAGLVLLDRLAVARDPGRLMSVHPEWNRLLHGTAPEEIARWWSSLDPTVAAHLVTAVPALVGTLDGVTANDRVAANRLRADDHLRALRAQRQALHERRIPHRRSTATEVLDRRAERARLEREIAYFEKVRDGTKLLYAWDPDRGSLIEMAGDPSTAKAALFVVPGTNTDADAFMTEHPVTDFAEWQVGSSGASVVAFTVMTGSMPQLDSLLEDGPQWNRFAEERGPEYARFLRGVDAAHPGLWTMSYEHSYGGGVGSEAEKHGGTVDTRFLAASVGAIGPYEPHAGTEYYATQAVDDVNRYYAGLGAGGMGFTVAPETIPGVRLVDPGLPGPNMPSLVAYGVTTNPAYLPRLIADSVGHHTALMSGDEKVNGPVLKAVRNLLRSEGDLQ
ncbi:hypothetical protein [Microbacterium sp. Bi128]|uniref:hypothetical protein n=1 Tax=Microbacterium sp. Bi128 TaxID=2821115 RepID=UPI001DA1615D|nr:hypothetical protein [Microbacterium sp. Bi128]CAH0159715.1 hypothetical protein SRABI128_00756 [Microbacterium sp. Bi128]